MAENLADLPDLSFAFAHSLSTGGTSAGLSSNLSFPLFDSGQRRARLDDAAAAISTQQRAFERTYLQTINQIEDAMDSWQTAAHSQATAAQVLAAGQVRERELLVAVSRGLETPQTLLTQQRVQLQQAQTLLLADQARLEAFIELNLALGRPL